MSQMLHVYTYLVSTSSLEDTFYKAYISYTFQHAVMGDSMLAY